MINYTYNKGPFSAIIEISKGFGASVADVDPKSIKIQGVTASRTIIVKNKFALAFFETQKLQNTTAGEKVELKLVGTLKNGTKFEGVDSIRIIGQGKFSVGPTTQLASTLTALRSILIQLSGLLER